MKSIITMPFSPTHQVMCSLAPSTGLADQDGSFTWKSTVKFSVQRYDGTAKKVRKPRPVSVAPRTVPLEVGYTKGSRTMLHLSADLGLARWPYGSEAITVFVTLDPLILKLPYSSRRTSRMIGEGK